MTAVDDRPVTSPEIGKDRRRKEDQRLITGRTRWTDNISLPGMLHMAIVRSPHAHARIRSVDLEAADKAINIYDVFDGKKLKDTMGTLVNAWPITTEQQAPTHYPLAVDEVTFAATTGVPESKIRVIAPDVGGGFGGKLQTTPEEGITWAVARWIGKPCKYTETRSESLMTAHHGRDQRQKLTLAATKEGRV